MKETPAQNPTTQVEVREHEVITYFVECPQCGIEHEHDHSLAHRPPFECICGTMVKVVK